MVGKVMIRSHRS